MKPAPKDEHAKLLPAPAVYVRLLLNQFANTEEDRQRLLAGTDVVESQLEKADAQVTVFSFISFAHNLNQAIGDEWPIRSFRIWTTPSHGALEVAVRSAATIADSLKLLESYGHVRGPYLVLKLQADEEHLSLRFNTTITSSDEAASALTITAMLSAVAMLEPMLDDQAGALKLRFKRSEPPWNKKLQELLTQPVLFGQLHDELIIPVDVSAHASPFHDPSLLASSVAALTTDSRRLRAAGTLAARIDSLLNQQIDGRMSADDVARELGLSRRTLTRRLTEHGLKFRSIQDEHLRERAAKLIGQASLSRSQKAELLGFQDETSFSRACRRWFR